MFWQLRPLGHPNTLSFGIMIFLLQKFIIFFFLLCCTSRGWEELDFHDCSVAVIALFFELSQP